MVNNRETTSNFTRPTAEEVENNNAKRHRFRWSVQEQKDLVYLKENEGWSNEEIAAFFNRTGPAIAAKYRAIRTNGMTSDLTMKGAGRLNVSSEDSNSENIRTTRSSERRAFDEYRKRGQTLSSSSSMNGKEKVLEEKEKILEEREKRLEEKEKFFEDTKKVVLGLEKRMKDLEKMLQEISEKYSIRK